MDHLIEIFKLLPLLKEVVTGGVLSDVESVVKEIEAIYNDWKGTQSTATSAVPVAPVAPVPPAAP